VAVETTVLRVSSRSTARPALLTKLIRTVRQQQLFTPGQHLLVGVSGGPDSVALLSLLHRLARSWRLTLTVAHCNYGLRGTESADDESFVDTFCRERQLPLVIHRPTVSTRRQRSSFQAAAREERYGFMKRLAHKVQADHIAIGHTANDQAETVLMWLLRGAGMTGLAGMPYARIDRIIRPLLAATRDEVLAYLHHEGLTYRRDSSNEKLLYHRNRIRKELLPVMTRLAPAAVSVLQRQADIIREDEQYMEEVTKTLVRTLVRHASGGRQQIDRRAFTNLPITFQRRLVRALLRAHDDEKRPSSFHVVEWIRRVILKGKGGTQLSLKRAHITLDRSSAHFSTEPGGDRGHRIDSEQEKKEMLAVSVPSTVAWAGTNQQIHVQLMTRRAADELGRFPSRRVALFDADRFSEPLVIRAWQAGDRFIPLGMKGKSKKLQDFFIDRKIERPTRGKVPLLVAPEGILWVVGMRQDERFAVHRGTTRCLVASVHSRSSEKE